MSWAVIVMLLATGADVASTTVKLRQGCVESNPVLKATRINTPIRIAVFEGGVSVGLVYTFGRTKKSHPKLTQAAAWGIAASHTAATVNNMMQDCRQGYSDVYVQGPLTGQKVTR